MVHTGRLLSLVVVGDFPKHHGYLCRLFSEPLYSGSVKADWLGGFAQLESKGTDIDKGKFNQEFRLLLHTNWLLRYGKALSALKQLRNEANYEALIIAHEKFHDRVTQLFERMAKTAEIVSSEAIDLAVEVYQAYMLDHPILKNERQEHLVASDYYMRWRFRGSIHEKVRSCESAEMKLRDLTERLTFADREMQLQQLPCPVENRILMTQFGPKSSLFDELEKEVKALEVAAWDTHPHIG